MVLESREGLENGAGDAELAVEASDGLIVEVTEARSGEEVEARDTLFCEEMELKMVESFTGCSWYCVECFFGESPEGLCRLLRFTQIEAQYTTSSLGTKTATPHTHKSLPCWQNLFL